MNHIEQEKALLRKRYLDLRASLDPKDRQAWSAVTYEHLFALPQWKAASVVCGYISIREEIDTSPILTKAWQQGKVVALPCTVTGVKEGQMVFRSLPSHGLSSLNTGRFGVPEPPEDCPELTLEQLQGSLMLLPGLAFDQEGYRIGYGGGYYDRFLEKALQNKANVLLVALAFSAFITERLPNAPHDFPAHILITEKGVHFIHGQT